MRRWMTACPSGFFRSTARLRLLRLKAAKNPAPNPPRPRVWSPLGAGSTLRTSAPSSAKTSPAVGPMTVWLNSRTRSPASGGAGVFCMVEPSDAGAGVREKLVRWPWQSKIFPQRASFVFGAKQATPLQLGDDHADEIIEATRHV